MRYFEHPDLPGKPMFDCSKLAATLQVSACADRFRKACGVCKGCEIGAGHAGELVSTNKLYGKTVCGRCGRAASRLIRRHLCVSCYNREREYLVGRNRHGGFPKEHPKLYAPVIVFEASGEQVATEALVGSQNELLTALVRDNDEISIGWGAYG